MIVGNGLIADAIKECDQRDVLFIAAGVSNSVNPTEPDFLREENLVRELLSKKFERYVYFSTVSTEDESMADKPYIQHKLKMEGLIKSLTKNYLILRLPNMLSIEGNPNTLIPNFFNCLQEGREVRIQKNAHRYLLSKLQLREMLLQLLKANVVGKVVNGVRKTPISVEEIYLAMASAMNAKSKYTLVEGGANYLVQQNFAFEKLPNVEIETIIKKQLAHSLY